MIRLLQSLRYSIGDILLKVLRVNVIIPRNCLGMKAGLHLVLLLQPEPLLERRYPLHYTTSQISELFILRKLLTSALHRARPMSAVTSSVFSGNSKPSSSVIN
jgi:hypothetical protein